MTATFATDLIEAAGLLHSHLRARYWTGSVLMGPDPGVRLNARAFRFAKSYMRALPWRDNLTYSQAQDYWIEGNLLGAEAGILNRADAREIVASCGRSLRSMQRPEGYWEYPNPEWRGRIATVEGNYASMGLIRAHEITNDDDLLQGAIDWYDYAVAHIGFQEHDGTSAINYFGNVPGGRVPNNSASAVKAFSMLASATGDRRFLAHCDAMVAFIETTQTPDGELPYAVPGETGGTGRPHFLCYQYNAFQFLNLADYHKLTGDDRSWRVLQRLARFIRGGILASGAARYECHADRPEVVYYATAVASAVSRATRMGLTEEAPLVVSAFERVLSRQRPDGSFPYSFGNYGILHDLRSYPRYEAMILTHLLTEGLARTGDTSSAGADPLA